MNIIILVQLIVINLINLHRIRVNGKSIVNEISGDDANFLY